MEHENMYTEQTNQELERGCPRCGGTMEFHPAEGKLFCPYCDHVIDITADKEVSEQAFYAAKHVGNFTWGEQQKQVICRSCGGQAVYDALQTSGTCPFCGSNQVMPEAVDTSLPPSGICPFGITQQQAGENFHNWIKGRIFTPSKAKKSARADSFSGFYVPYWTFDTLTDSAYTARYGKNRVYKDSKGNRQVRTDWYSTSGDLQLMIDDEITHGTTRHDLTIFSRIEPYDTKACVPYSPEYLAGYVSERYSVGLHDAWENTKPKVDRRIENAIERQIRNYYHADHVRITSRNTMYNDLTYKYLLVPLWQSSFEYKGKTFQFMVNGQTGQVGGKAPVSALRVAIACVLGAILAALLFLLFSGSEFGDFSMDAGNSVISQESMVEVPEVDLGIDWDALSDEVNG
ncbi:MAG: hypothetical protein IKU55_03000 [Clostridia bacterium]|nr:hypothetical protein [Clostridia bacterium]